MNSTRRYLGIHISNFNLAAPTYVLTTCLFLTLASAGVTDRNYIVTVIDTRIAYPTLPRVLLSRQPYLKYNIRGFRFIPLCFVYIYVVVTYIVHSYLVMWLHQSHITSASRFGSTPDGFTWFHIHTYLLIDAPFSSQSSLVNYLQHVFTEVQR